MTTQGLVTERWEPQRCERVLWNDNSFVVLAGRTMDWPESTEPLLLVLPRGMRRDGGRLAGTVVGADNPALWTSKYGYGCCLCWTTRRRWPRRWRMRAATRH